MKISEIIIDKYKLLIPPTVFYDLLADVREAEDEQEPNRQIEDYENEIDNLQKWLDIAEYDKERLREKVTNLEAKIKSLEQEPKGAEMMQLHETLEYGQGYDDDIVDVLKSFQKFRDGYYELINNGDDWWDVFNQSIEFQEIMKKAWGEIEDADIMGNLEKMAIAIAGGYIRFDKFVDGVIQAYEDGYGFRHKAESGEKNEQK